MRSRRASALRALGDPETPAAPWAASKRAVRHTRVGRMTSPRKIIRVVNEKPDAKRLVPHRTVERSLSPCNQHVSTLPCPGSSGRPYGPVPRSSQVRPAHVGSVWLYIGASSENFACACSNTQDGSRGFRPAPAPTYAHVAYESGPAYRTDALCAPGHYTWRGTCTPLYET
jgi:hypothetical protein